MYSHPTYKVIINIQVLVSVLCFPCFNPFPTTCWLGKFNLTEHHLQIGKKSNIYIVKFGRIEGDDQIKELT